jgi:hypothetical protein
MPDISKDQLEARAAAEKAKHDADAAAAAKAKAAEHADPTATLVAAVKDIQSRINPAGVAHATVGLDETQPGGIYIVKGVKVNAHGRELKADGSIKHPEEQRVNEFGQMV